MGSVWLETARLVAQVERDELHGDIKLGMECTAEKNLVDTSARLGVRK